MTIKPFPRDPNNPYWFDYPDRFRLRPGLIHARNAPQPIAAPAVITGSTAGSAYSAYHPATEWASLRLDHCTSRTWALDPAYDYSFATIFWGDRMFRSAANSTGEVGGYFKSRFSSFPQQVINHTVSSASHTYASPTAGATVLVEEFGPKEADVVVTYGTGAHEATAVLTTDYTVTLNSGDDYADFSVTFTQSLVDKIAAIIALDGSQPDQVVIRYDDTRSTRINFTTMELADASTIIKIMAAIGYTEAEYLADSYVIAGRTSMGWSSAELTARIKPITEYNASTATYFTENSGAGDPYEFWSARDWVATYAGSMTDLPAGSIVDIDYEIQDGRSEEHTLAFITHIANLVHAKGFKLGIWPNELGEAGAIYSGITANNAPEILAVVDYLSLLAYRVDGEEDVYNVQDMMQTMWATLTGNGRAVVDPTKVMVTFSTGDPGTGGNEQTTIYDAASARRLANLYNVGYVRVWRNFANPGDPDPQELVNRLTETFLLGSNVYRPAGLHNFY